MGEWFANLDGLETLFIVFALGGGVPLLLTFIMQFFMGGAGGVDDALHAGGAPGDVGDLSGAHTGDPGTFATDATAGDPANAIGSVLSFKFLSFQGITAFFTMFGLVGFVLYRQGGVGTALAIGGGVIAGLICVWLISLLFSFFNRLQSSGSISPTSAINCTGEVYLTIPEGGTGKVMITVEGRLREYDAVADDGRRLATGARIRVTRVAGSTLYVKPDMGI